MKEDFKEKKELEEKLKPFGSGLYRTITTPLMIPTRIRKFVNRDYEDYKQLSKKEKRRYFSGLITGGSIEAISLTGMAIEAPYAFLGLVATNTISGLFELGRYTLGNISAKAFARMVDENFIYLEDHSKDSI